MISIEQIKQPIKEEFNFFEIAFSEAFQSNNEILKAVGNYVLQNKGKRIRPILTLLSAKICGTPNKTTINGAVSMELLHTASLIHDDIVDDTFERRGRKSVNAVWKNKIAVLAGDYLLSKALGVANETKNFEVLNDMTNLGKELAEGELLQISNTQNISIDENKYFEMIIKKTATLFSTCTKIGALSVNANEEKIKTLQKFGEIYGTCFQMRDDVFDYISSEKEIGKPVGNDIREGKITLPLLYALNNNSDNTSREKYLNIFKAQDFSQSNVEELISFAKKSGGIEYAERKMQEFEKEAIRLIEPFSENETKTALLMALRHTIERTF